jgi:hypothetical protein
MLCSSSNYRSLVPLEYKAYNKSMGVVTLVLGLVRKPTVYYVLCVDTIRNCGGGGVATYHAHFFFFPSHFLFGNKVGRETRERKRREKKKKRIDSRCAAVRIAEKLAKQCMLGFLLGASVGYQIRMVNYYGVLRTKFRLPPRIPRGAMPNFRGPVIGFLTAFRWRFPRLGRGARPGAPSAALAS